MNYTRVKVTKNDIANGIKGDEHHCPIANCINRYTKNGCRVLQQKTILNGQSVEHNLLTFLKILFYDIFGKMSPFYIKIPSDWISKSDNLISKSEIKSYKLTTPSEIYHPLIGLKSEKVYQ